MRSCLLLYYCFEKLVTLLLWGPSPLMLELRVQLWLSNQPPVFTQADSGSNAVLPKTDTTSQQHSPASHDETAFTGPLLEAEHCLPACRRQAKSLGQKYTDISVSEDNGAAEQAPPHRHRADRVGLQFLSLGSFKTKCLEMVCSWEITDGLLLAVAE